MHGFFDFGCHGNAYHADEPEFYELSTFCLTNVYVQNSVEIYINFNGDMAYHCFRVASTLKYFYYSYAFVSGGGWVVQVPT